MDAARVFIVILYRAFTNGLKTRYAFSAMFYPAEPQANLRLPKRGLALLFLILSLAALGAGCSSRRIGWGLVLWTVKGTGAKAGTLVPVYLKSNITKNYVIGLEEDPKARVEVPLWQVEFYPSKRAALRHAEEIKPLASIYLIAGRDGLPVRAQPSNKAERSEERRVG